MKQLMRAAQGRLEWHEAPAPTLESDAGALIRPLAVARCDIDMVQIHDIPFPEPFALGHECIGEVLEVGDSVRQVQVGQRVIVPYQVSCGACRHCNRGYTASCGVEHGASMFGMRPLSEREWGGLLAEQAYVPYADAMLVPLPPALDPLQCASLADNATMGYGAVVGALQAHPGAEVLVVTDGSGSVPLYATQAALALNASRVVLMSGDRQVLELAQALGAEPAESDLKARRGRFPVVVEATKTVDGLRFALLSTEVGGICVNTGPLVGVTQDASLPLGMMYGRGIDFRSGAVHTRAHLPGMLSLVVSGRLRPQEVTTRVVDWSEVLDAYREPATKLVVDCQA